LALLQSPLSHAALIQLQPGSTIAGPGDTVSLDLVVSGLGNFTPVSLGAFDIGIGFDSSVLSFGGYTLGSFLGDIGLAEAIDASFGGLVGEVNVGEVSLLSAVSLDALQPSEFLLATLDFNVIALSEGATTQLSVLSGSLLADAFGQRVAVDEVGTASIEGRATAPVPVPGTLLLLFASLCGWRLSQTSRNRAHK
tara:strand:- start:3085 stop:3669 length:585 start_codon:yes stop_codon:yes gene_type:complete